MVTVMINIERPENGFAEMHKLIKTIPNGLIYESAGIPEGNTFNIVLRGKRKNSTYDAATYFVTNFSGIINSVTEKIGKKITVL